MDDFKDFKCSLNMLEAIIIMNVVTDKNTSYFYYP